MILFHHTLLDQQLQCTRHALATDIGHHGEGLLGGHILDHRGLRARLQGDGIVEHGKNPRMRACHAQSRMHLRGIANDLAQVAHDALCHQGMLGHEFVGRSLG